MKRTLQHRQLIIINSIKQIEWLFTNYPLPVDIVDIMGDIMWSQDELDDDKVREGGIDLYSTEFKKSDSLVIGYTSDNDPAYTSYRFVELNDEFIDYKNGRFHNDY